MVTNEVAASNSEIGAAQSFSNKRIGGIPFSK